MLADDRGMTLAEVVIAIIILSLGIMSMTALQGVSSLNNERGAKATQALNLAQEKLELARAALYDNQTPNDYLDFLPKPPDKEILGDDYPGFSYYFTDILNNYDVDGTAHLTVDVFYTVGKAELSVSLTTNVAVENNFHD